MSLEPMSVPISWPMSVPRNRANRLVDPLADRLFLRGQVEHLAQLTPRMRLGSKH